METANINVSCDLPDCQNRVTYNREDQAKTGTSFFGTGRWRQVYFDVDVRVESAMHVCPSCDVKRFHPKKGSTE